MMKNTGNTVVERNADAMGPRDVVARDSSHLMERRSMSSTCEEVRELVSVLERIHKALQGDQFSHDEKEWVVMCASEWIASAKNQNASGEHVRLLP